MTENTALDAFVGIVARWGYNSIDDAVRQMLYGPEYEADFPGARHDILQDPRYLAYCDEQNIKAAYPFTEIGYRDNGKGGLEYFVEQQGA